MLCSCIITANRSALTPRGWQASSSNNSEWSRAEDFGGATTGEQCTVTAEDFQATHGRRIDRSTGWEQQATCGGGWQAVAQLGFDGGDCGAHHGEGVRAGDRVVTSDVDDADLSLSMRVMHRDGDATP